jgi:Terminase RNaseH-like domain
VRKLRQRAGDPIYQVGHLERLPLQTPYPGVVSHVERMLTRLPEGTELVLDYTGVGRPVFDLFTAKGIWPLGISITAGDTVTQDRRHYHVPKLILISTVQALLHEGRLKIHKGLADVQALVNELQDFRAEVTDSGYWRFGARAGKHDDLVLALAIALWRAVGRDSTTGMIEYYRQLVEDDRAEAATVPGSAAARAEPATVTFRAPDGISTVYTRRCINIGPDRLVKVSERDAVPLRQAGWQELETKVLACVLDGAGRKGAQPAESRDSATRQWR